MVTKSISHGLVYSISVVSVWHVTGHYGPLVEYLRTNGIVPPMTQKYGKTATVRGGIFVQSPDSLVFRI